MAFLRKTTAYIKMGYLLHIITLAELAGLYILLHNGHVWAWVLRYNSVTRFFMLVPVLWAPIFPQLDARSRFQNYKMMKDCFYLYGFDIRLLRYFSKSRCQRDAVLVAAAEAGLADACRAYFKQCSYRWYHLLPDIIFEKPVVLLSWAFYQQTFFAKTYRSKTAGGCAQVNAYKNNKLRAKAA